MFYSHSLLSRNGPLGTIWVAAHFIKKLKKEQIAHTDISSSVGIDRLCLPALPLRFFHMASKDMSFLSFVVRLVAMC
ncbi:hypothetical protein GW17_00011831 [Ensete ventricosum]|nr:hypothetical protein GW17_00011831 [Ensete ventricosum]RZR85465.1 hypothetical protein BHM03_00012456 [Ensete ventricosum]